MRDNHTGRVGIGNWPLSMLNGPMVGEVRNLPPAIPDQLMEPRTVGKDLQLYIVLGLMLIQAAPVGDSVGLLPFDTSKMI